jgi:hypothetical protein
MVCDYIRQCKETGHKKARGLPGLRTKGLQSTSRFPSPTPLFYQWSAVAPVGVVRFRNLFLRNPKPILASLSPRSYSHISASRSQHGSSSTVKDPNLFSSVPNRLDLFTVMRSTHSRYERRASCRRDGCGFQNRQGPLANQCDNCRGMLNAGRYFGCSK